MENSFMIQRDCRNINWITAADIFLKAPLGTREPDTLKKTFENSQLVCFVLSKQELIGMGRAISNGINSAAIYDIVVLPQYQGKGVGTRIMEDLLKRLEGQSIVLYSVPGKEPFYMKFGFKVLKTGMGILSERLQNAGKGYIKQAEDFVAYQNWYKNDFCISTNPLKLQIDVVHQFLATSYWAKKIPINIVRKSIENALNFGLYFNNTQIGFARVITDYATFAYLGDVFILEKHRGNGLGTWLIECVMSHPDLQNLRNWSLLTSDAHQLYRKFGFQTPESLTKFMEIRKPDLYL